MGESMNHVIKLDTNGTCSLERCLHLLFQTHIDQMALFRATKCSAIGNRRGVGSSYSILAHWGTELFNIEYACKELHQQIEIPQNGVYIVKHRRQFVMVRLEPISCQCNFIIQHLIPCRHYGSFDVY